MGTVRACHKCEVYVEVRDSFEGQKTLRAFASDHKGHPAGNVDSGEVEAYTDVTSQYA